MCEAPDQEREECFLSFVAGGAGGKGTWGNPLIPYTEFGKADPADPNYDSDEVCMLLVFFNISLCSMLKKNRYLSAWRCWK